MAILVDDELGATVREILTVEHNAVPESISPVRVKRIGSEARQELEQLMDAKVFLELFVKVRSGWAADEAHLRSYGYE